jgi:hypothetical protein
MLYGRSHTQQYPRAPLRFQADLDQESGSALQASAESNALRDVALFDSIKSHSYQLDMCFF